MSQDALHYASRLVEFPSVSRSSNVDVTDYVERELRSLGFDVERIEYDDAFGVRKASVVGRRGPGAGGMAYFGHTDVVPADDWRRDQGPFEPTVEAGRLYGRGSCDMKGSVACMLAAAAIVPVAEQTRPLTIVCTADEEVGYHGAQSIVARSTRWRELVAQETYGVVGEPTRLRVVHAHKGTCGFRVVSRGRAAHSSTTEGLNANLAMIPFLVEMKAIHDESLVDPAWLDDRFSPPTISWNIGVNDFTRACNITPPQSVCTVYFRPMPGQNPHRLLERVEAAAARQGLEFHLENNSAPLCVEPDAPQIRDLLELTGQERAETVCYGTDGGVFRDLRGLAVIGPGDIAQAHTNDEWIDLDELRRGTDLYARLIRRWSCQ